MNCKIDVRKDRLLRPQAVADRLQVTTRQVYNLIAQAHFRVMRVGERSIRIWESSVFEYMDRQTDLAEIRDGILDE